MMRSSLLLTAVTGCAASLLALVATRGAPPHGGRSPDRPNDTPAEAPAAVAVPPQEIERTPSWVITRTVDGPPVSLTASDGSGLALAELRASAVVEGPLAYTEMHLAFDNPENRVREGTFKIALPQGASIGRFAMKIDGAWQEGEVVPKEQARVAYEDALHRKQDPALFERGAGNEFTARVFPIPPHGRKELVVSYAQELVGGAPYALPLRGLPEVGVLDLSVAGVGLAAQHEHHERYAPTTDFVLEAKAKEEPRALRSGDLAVVKVRPVAEAMPEPVTAAVVMVDTSASRALGLAAELRSVQALLGGLAARRGGALPVTVAAFDQEVVSLYHGDAAGFGAEQLDRLTARRALGASNLEKALTWAQGEAKKTGATRIVLVTDGVPTAGADDAARLAKAASALREGGAERLDVVAVGGLRDDALAHRLVTAGLAHDGVVVDGGEAVATLVRRLEAGTRSKVTVAVEGATWSYPTRLDGVQAGDEVLVYAEMPEGASLRVRVGDGAATTYEAASVDRPLVERAWAEAKIASLEAEEREHGKTFDLRQRIVALSTGHRVLSAYTALLVLETDADYARFQIDRRALADILTVDGGRLALAKRLAAPTDRPRGTGADPWGAPRPATTAAASAAPTAPAGDDADRAPLDAVVGGIGSAGGRRESGAADGLPRFGGGEGLGAIGGAGHGASGPSGSALDEVRKSASNSRDVEAEEPPMEPAAQPVGAAPLAPVAPPVAAAPAAPRARLSAPRPAPAAPPAPAGGGIEPDPVAQGEMSLVAPPSDVAAPHRALVPRGQQLGGAPSDMGVEPFTGTFRLVKERLARRDAQGALGVAETWQAGSPGDVLALVALGEASEATGDATTAARAYGSLIDLFPARADLRRFAGERLEHVKGGQALELAIDTFDKARRDRPDHPASHRLAAFARLRRGEYAAAFDILVAGIAQPYPSGRFRGVDRILREDLGLVAAAWARAEPSRKAEILARLRAAGGSVEDAPSIRFVLNWETDANDVDFHIHDALGGHAFYGAPHLPSGGDLYADVTTGYGPECFTVRAARADRAGPYSLQAHYFSRGPMGYGMGKLEIIDHDGRGGLTFEERPFVVMADHAFVNLGTTN